MGEHFLILILTAVAVGVLSWFLLPGPWAGMLLWMGRKASGLRSFNVSVGGLRWHFLRGGRGVTLVTIHGFGADADNWQRVSPIIKDRFEIIAPDLIGFGSSDPGDALPFTIDDQVERLWEWLNQLDVGPCVMAGSSMGGWIASRFAQKFPERVTGLWLLAPLGVEDCEPGELLTNIDTGQSNPLSISSPADFEHKVFRPMFSSPPYLPRPLKTHYMQRAIRRSKASQRMFTAVHASTPPLEAIIQERDIPILIQWGDKDRAVHVSGADRLRNEICQGEVIIQHNVGHLPMLETPGPRARQFMQFAERYGLAGSDPV